MRCTLPLNIAVGTSGALTVLRRFTRPACLLPRPNAGTIVLGIQSFSRGIPYTPEGTIQDFTSSPRHVGIERLFQEKDEAMLGRTRPGANYNGPIVTTREGSRPLFSSSSPSPLTPPPRRQSGGPMGTHFSEDSAPSPIRSGNGSQNYDGTERGTDFHHDHRPSMQQFFAASVASSGDSYRPDCRTDPQYAHLPDHMRSAQQSILDMQHDSYGESIRGMVPPPPPIDPFEAPVAYNPPKVAVPKVWYVVVLGFLGIFSLMGTYGH